MISVDRKRNNSGYIGNYSIEFFIFEKCFAIIIKFLDS